MPPAVHPDRPGTASPKAGAGKLNAFNRLKTKNEPMQLVPTELECGQLSSCSDSDDSCSEETLDMVLGNAGRSGSGDQMNDVDDETMSGDNDVSFLHPSVGYFGT